jgi:aryl-alcohol dehydrogenase-like predicted oxidoreductase
VLLGGGTIGGIGSARRTWGQGLIDEEALAVLGAASDLGINVIDTANTYAGGHSEEVIGGWLAGHPGADVLIATKVGGVVDADTLSVCLKRQEISRNFAHSAARLGRSSIDLYLAHAPDDSTPIGETLEAFAELIEAGKVRAVGACNLDRHQLSEALDEADRLGLPRYEWVQNQYNLLAREDEDSVVPLCRERGLGYTPHSVLCGGILAGRFLPGQPLPARSAVAIRPEAHAEQLTPDILTRVQRLLPEAEALGVSVPALALAWVLANTDVTAALVAPRRRDQFAMVEEALALSLDGDQRDKISALLS